jgi:hypothetical protein
MNQFAVDFRKQALPGEAAMETLERMGRVYRERVMKANIPIRPL